MLDISLKELLRKTAQIVGSTKTTVVNQNLYFFLLKK